MNLRPRARCYDKRLTSVNFLTSLWNDAIWSISGTPNTNQMAVSSLSIWMTVDSEDWHLQGSGRKQRKKNMQCMVDLKPLKSFMIYNDCFKTRGCFLQSVEMSTTRLQNPKISSLVSAKMSPTFTNQFFQLHGEFPVFVAPKKSPSRNAPLRRKKHRLVQQLDPVKRDPQNLKAVVDMTSAKLYPHRPQWQSFMWIPRSGSGGDSHKNSKEAQQQNDPGPASQHTSSYEPIKEKRRFIILK